MKNAISLLVGITLASTPISFSPVSAAEDKDVAEKKKTKITDRRHPDYVRCRSEPVIGSLARKKRVCMTNREWTAHNAEGNKRSREMVDQVTQGMGALNGQ